MVATSAMAAGSWGRQSSIPPSRSALLRLAVAAAMPLAEGPMMTLELNFS
jgi:hypothetical protein